MGRDSRLSVSTSNLSLEEASAVLVSLLSGHTPSSLDEIRDIAERLKGRGRRSTQDLIAEIKVVGQQLVQAMAGDDMVVAGPNLLAAQARGRALAKSWNALCQEVWSRPARAPEDAIPYAYVALFHTYIQSESIGIETVIPFVKLVLAVLETEEVHHA